MITSESPAANVPRWLPPIVSGITGHDVGRLRSAASSGLSGATYWIAEFTDGESAFVKVATRTRQRTRLRHEHDMHRALRAPFMLTDIGFASTTDGAVLVMEDAERAAWPPPWTHPQIAAVTEMLAEVRASQPPVWLHRVGGPDLVAPRESGWKLVEEDPEPFLALGLASREWLVANVGALQAAQERMRFGGTALTHLDVRSDNLCFLDGRPRLIDWSDAWLGHPYLDQHHWAMTLVRETGVRRPELLTADGPDHLAALLGYYAAAEHYRAQIPPAIQEMRLGALRTALPWACDLLGLESPRSVVEGE